MIPEHIEHLVEVSRPLRSGDTRTAVRRVSAGWWYDVGDNRVTIKVDMLIDVTEEWQGGWNNWITMKYHYDTLRPAPPVPTRWQRLKAWLMHPVRPTNLPPARLLDEK